MKLSQKLFKIARTIIAENFYMWSGEPISIDEVISEFNGWIGTGADVGIFVDRSGGPKFDGIIIQEIEAVEINTIGSGVTKEQCIRITEPNNVCYLLKGPFRIDDKHRKILCAIAKQIVA